MRRRGIGLGAGLSALMLAGGCDDGTVITRVDRRPGFSLSQVVAMAAGGVPTEVHGAPFPGAAPDDVAARLAMPASFAAGTTFRAATPGAADTRRRLVLVFNPSAPPNGLRDCRRVEPAPTREPGATGFAVTATFCEGERMLATGHLEARRTQADDWAGFTRVMRLLLRDVMDMT